jgi:putative Mg2+ transporter-C (MgtC) family protein
MLATINQVENWQVEGALQLVLAAFLGGLVGLEREYHGRAAGFRTHLLVSTGCCLVMLVSQNFARVYGTQYVGSDNVIRVDPARLAYSVMGGIGFLGAGAIVKSGLTIRGLTTAACLWCSAAMGLAVGAGMYGMSLVTAGIILAALLVLSRFEKMVSHHWYKKVVVVCNDVPEEIEAIERILEQQALKVLDVTFDRDLDTKTLEISYSVRLESRHLTPMIYQALAGHSGLRKIRVE